MKNKKGIFKKIEIIIFFVGFFLAVKVDAQWNPDELDTFNLPYAPIYVIAAGILNWLLVIFGVIGIIGFIISGLVYLTAAGDETRIGTAKKAMTFSIIGVIVGLSGFVILQAVTFMLSGSWQF